MFLYFFYKVCICIVHHADTVFSLLYVFMAIRIILPRTRTTETTRRTPSLPSTWKAKARRVPFLREPKGALCAPLAFFCYLLLGIMQVQHQTAATVSPHICRQTRTFAGHQGQQSCHYCWSDGQRKNHSADSGARLFCKAY
jgi:hypothetical protein